MVKRRNAAVPQVLIHWSNQTAEEATWEDYELIASKYPHFMGQGGRVGGEENVTDRKW